MTMKFALAAIFLALCQFAIGQHPLDSLTGDEYSRASSLVKAYRPGDWVFSWILLHEPPKSELLPYFLSNTVPPPGTFPRRAFVSGYDNNVRRGFEVIVNLDTNEVESFVPIHEGTQPLISPEEQEVSRVIAWTNATVQARCALAGYPNMATVHADGWNSGYVEDKEEYRDRRLIVLFMYGSQFVGDNYYAHPFDFNVVVDLIERRVIKIENMPTHDDFDAENLEGNEVPQTSRNYDPIVIDPEFYRKDLKPVKVSQPEGASFTVTGNLVQWQKFQMRLGFNVREGMVLYHVSYNDSGTVRPLFYRMSLAEMFVPYGDPRPPHHRKHAYDVGEYGLGFCIMELEAGVDCIGSPALVDTEFHELNGSPYSVPNAACISEVDSGLLWKHYDLVTDRTSTTRSQKLHISFMVNVGNYDYLVTWKFGQDGSVDFEAQLTGILNVNLLAVNATPAGHGTEVSLHVNGHYHQHFFSMRLDVEIDGNENSVVIQDVVPLAAPTGSAGNPYGQGFTTNVTLLRTAGESRSNVAPELHRSWIVRNPNSINPNTEQPVGWKLVPWPSQKMHLKDESPLFPRAAWNKYNTWVLPYKENQLFPGGFYLNNTGLPDWVAENQNANIDNTDIVLWHNFGLSHVPRVEDFPVMPVETIGFHLKPVNFFVENPALDVPPPRAARQHRRAKKPRMPRRSFRR